MFKNASIYAGIFIALCFMSGSVFSSPKQLALSDLSARPDWSILIFYKNKSLLADQSYYLDKSTLRTPLSEMQASIAELSRNPSIVCKYPARYFWLSGHLDSLKIDFSICKKLPDTTQELRLLMVGSYLKNPASTFGHVIVSVGRDARGDLLDASYNFGAAVPQGENSVLYILKGLFGFYRAGFTQSEFFLHDAAYLQQEQRDIWEYVLNLNQEQKMLLHYFLYESLRVKVPYFFTKQNCAYKTSELLDLAYASKNYKNKSLWYSPHNLFYGLYDIKNYNVVKSINFWPSEQKFLYQWFSRLNKSEKNIINDFIKTKDFSIINNTFNISMLDFLLMYQNYKLKQSGDAEDLAIKKELVRERFKRELSEKPVLSWKDELRPDKGVKPSVLFFNITEDIKNSFLGLTAFERNPLARGNAIDSEFKILSMNFSYVDKLGLDKFELLSLTKYDNSFHPIYGESKPAWHVSFGYNESNLEERSAWYLRGKVGASYYVSPSFFINVMFGVELNSSSELYSGLLSTSVIKKSINNSLKLNYSFNVYDSDKNSIDYSAEWRHHINKHWDISLVYKKSNASLGVNYFW